jgi:YQGE family putative transporter
MAASASMAGAYSIFLFLLGLIMYMETGSALSVGGFASIQALASIITALIAGRIVTRATRVRSMALGTAVLAAAGVMVSIELSVMTLIAFGIMRSIAAPLFDIPHFSVRMDIISKCLRNPWERIEYIAAWEVPLAAGRIVMMTAMVGLYAGLGTLGLKIMLCILSCMRIVTFFLLKNTHEMRGDERAQPADAAAPL